MNKNSDLDLDSLALHTFGPISNDDSPHRTFFLQNVEKFFSYLDSLQESRSKSCHYRKVDTKWSIVVRAKFQGNKKVRYGDIASQFGWSSKERPRQIVEKALRVFRNPEVHTKLKGTNLND